MILCCRSPTNPSRTFDPNLSGQTCNEVWLYTARPVDPGEPKWTRHLRETSVKPTWCQSQRNTRCCQERAASAHHPTAAAAHSQTHDSQQTCYHTQHWHTKTYLQPQKHAMRIICNRSNTYWRIKNTNHSLQRAWLKRQLSNQKASPLFTEN